MTTIALTPGEPAGIGPDLTCMLAARERSARIVAIADPELLRERAAMLGMSLEPVAFRGDGAGVHAAGRLEVVATALGAPAVPGELTRANADYVLATLREAAAGCLAGRYHAMVTAPVHKGAINDAGIAFSGHTELLASLTSAASPLMMLIAGELRVALATTHLPLREVADALDAERLERCARTLYTGLQRGYGIAAPRLLVAGLNPHAGENGYLGREEIEVIAPVLERLRAEGLELIGPLPADTLFTPRHLDTADAVLAMYHDQGLPVLKYAGFGRAVNVTLGLPIVRTSVDHGTALALAGSGRADPGSLLAAVAEAQRLASGASR